MRRSDQLYALRLRRNARPKVERDTPRIVEAYIYVPIGLVAIAALLWVYGKDRPAPVRSIAWLGWSVLGTVAACVLGIFIAAVGAMTAFHAGGTTSRALALGFAPLLVAVLVVIISARDRAGSLPPRPRLFRLIAAAVVAVILILVSYWILSA